MSHRVLLLVAVLAGCGDVVIPGPDCDPIGEAAIAFDEVAGDCGAFPALEGELESPRIDTDPRGYRCAWRPERTATCGLAFVLTCEAMPPLGELEVEGLVENDEDGALAGEATATRYDLEGDGVACSSTYRVTLE